MSKTTTTLDDRARALLDFERDWPAHQGGKRAAISRHFGITPARYYQLLARVIDLDAAAAYDPLTVRRLQRRRDDRSRRRTARALGEGYRR